MTVNRIIKRLVFLLVVVTGIIFLVFSNTSIIDTPRSLSVTEAADAKSVVKEIVSEFSSSRNVVELTLSQRDLDAVAATASHLFSKTRFGGNISPLGISILASKQVDFLLFNQFINLHCFFTPGYERFEIESCQLGRVPIAGSIARWVLVNGSLLVFSSEVSKTVTMLLDDAKLFNQQLVLKTIKSPNFKNDVNGSLKDAANFIRKFSQKESVEADKVEHYIMYLEEQDWQHESLAFYIGQLFREVRRLSKNNNDFVAENTAALWALAIVYANADFARYIGLDYVPKHDLGKITLRGRHDLKLHFLYSVFLEQLSRVEISIQIGEIKELLDTNNRGSGFSFADLAADKAGVLFSQRLTGDEDVAKQAAAFLSMVSDESKFFPFVHDLPEGFKKHEFNSIFGSIDSSLYKKLEASIDERLRRLPLFDKDSKDRIEYKPNVAISHQESMGTWLTVDSHVHSKFSDGEFTVKEIAAKAVQFGCDAIAITDHGDHNLTGVASKEYFKSIHLAGVLHDGLTVIPGLEWNIPPFMGREHATLLLPDTPNIQQVLSLFREKYDSWGRRSEQLLSAKEAFNWLDNNARNNRTSPVVMYNHPSRKDKQSSENLHDMVNWRSYTDLVIGFSGAPGHQKKRGNNNGSYQYELKTINGWDPSIANIGGEWDVLLQQRYKVSGARAPSDFHNVKMDYWPCQFSTTHLLATSNTHNGVLQAFKRGNFWAQHGKVLKNLNFNVRSIVSNNVAQMGQTLRTTNDDELIVNLELSLNELDWQGVETSLDEVELIVISDNEIISHSFDPLLVERNKRFHFTFEHELSGNNVVFRWRGRSFQPEKHDYMFYTNPVYVVSKSE